MQICEAAATRPTETLTTSHTTTTTPTTSSLQPPPTIVASTGGLSCPSSTENLMAEDFEKSLNNFEIKTKKAYAKEQQVEQAETTETESDYMDTSGGEYREEDVTSEGSSTNITTTTTATNGNISKDSLAEFNSSAEMDLVEHDDKPLDVTMPKMHRENEDGEKAENLKVSKETTVIQEITITSIQRKADQSEKKAEAYEENVASCSSKDN